MATLNQLLTTLDQRATHLTLSKKEWARRAGVPAETLSRLATRESCDFSTLNALAGAVDMLVSLQPASQKTMPTSFGRDQEEALLVLCASEQLDLVAWLAAGSRYFMAGLAVMVAGEQPAKRMPLLALADALYPGMTHIAEFQRWLDATPVRPSRFLPSLAVRVAATHPASKRRRA